MRRLLGPLAALAAAAAAWAATQGCPHPTPTPLGPGLGDAELPDASDASVAAVQDAPRLRSRDTPPATALDPDGPRVRDPRFQPTPSERTPEGTAPTVVPTAPPDGDRAEPPDIGPAAIEALKERFGCQTLGQLSWPVSWLSPTGVVLMCCNQADAQAPSDPDAFHMGCLLPFECSYLIDEGMGAISKIETVTALRQRLAPLRDARTALAVVAASIRDVVPFFGDRPEELQLVTTGPWSYTQPTLTGTRVVERPEGGYDVTTFVVPGCGCHHDLIEVQLLVDELAGVTEQSRTTAIEDKSGLCVD